MAPVVDETAEDLPVRDTGVMRRGLMPTVPDTLRGVKPWKKHNVLKTKDPQRLFRFPREHLEDLCLRLQEENSVLRQHTCTQEQRLRRMSTRLMRLSQAHPGPNGVKERNTEDTIQELETRVAKLENQKEMLQNKLSLAKQHIMDLGGRTPYRFSKGKSVDLEGGVRRLAQTAPPRYGPTLDDRTEMERLRSSVAEQVRVAELEMTAQALRDTLRDKEMEIEGTVRDIRKQHADRLRISIRENVDVIRLQKQLSEKNTALRVTQEKFTNLQELYENQLTESQRSLKEGQGALLEKVEGLTEQLKQERERVLLLEEQLSSSTLSRQTLDKLQERISDVEGERDLIKENYDTLLDSTLSVQCKRDEQVDKHKEVDQKREKQGENISRADIQRLEERLLTERDERCRLELETENLRREREILEEQRRRERELSVTVRNKEEHLEQEVLQYREQVSALQGRLDCITKEFDMSIEELSETLLQIKAFRMQQEGRMALSFLTAQGKIEDSPHELANIQATHAETVLELQKTRNLLLLEHQISKDLQEELNTVKQKMEREREEGRRKMSEKDKLLLKRVRQINSLQAQLKELAYSPRNYKRTIPVQYTWQTGDEEVIQPIEDDIPFSQLRAGESLLEIHLKTATFTPAGLRTMGSIRPEEDIVTFCTYSLLDFELHSTPLVSGCQPKYSFTSRYALSARDLGRLEGQGSRVRVELHQALGGVWFVTHGNGQMHLEGAFERSGERVSGHVNITGSEGEHVGVVEFCVCLFGPAEPVVPVLERGADRRAPRMPVQLSPGWEDAVHKELRDYGGGIPNELVVMLERCVGLNARWPGLVPEAYLSYRLYDLPPHISQRAQCTTDPVFNDTTSYPLAVTSDLLHYMSSSSLWVYVFDESDDQVPRAYLAKTPIPLQDLAAGREIRGDYVLRDPAGGPRGMVRVMIKWRYPFQPPMDSMPGQHGGQDKAMEGPEREERRREKAEGSQRPVAKPRMKSQPSPTKQKSSAAATRQSTDRKRFTKRLPDLHQHSPHLTAEPGSITPSHLPTRKSSEGTSSRQSHATLSRRSSSSDAGTRDLPSMNLMSVEQDEEEEKERSESAAANESPESSESSSSQSDIIICPPQRKVRKGDKLRVEILSLMFDPSSHVALDKSIQRVYVEYRLLGVPVETTETPMSLRKPTKGEDIHYNFTRVIYVDGSQAAPLRHYIYTILEGSDPNQGRLKFTVVSEPMDNDEECVDVGHAFLDLKELLLTGNDVIDQQIDIVSLDEDQEVIGNLKVSLETAKVLTGIYKEFHQKSETKEEDTNDDEEEEEKTDEDEEEEEKKKDLLKLIDCDDDISDF